MPQPSTDTNDIVLKMLYAMAKGMDHNIGALHATHGMRDKDTNATHGGMGRSWLIAPWRVGGLVTLARLRRWKRLLHPEVVVMVPTQCPPKTDPHLVRQRPDQVRQRMRFFSAVMLTRLRLLW